MADLSFHTDARYLHARWDHQFAVFKIVARDYRAVFAGEHTYELHRDILIQTVSELLDTEEELKLRAQPSPVRGLVPPDRGLWDAAVPWVRKLHEWRIPSADMSLKELNDDLLLRKDLEERFNAVVQRNVGEPADHDVEPSADGCFTLPGSSA